MNLLQLCSCSTSCTVTAAEVWQDRRQDQEKMCYTYKQENPQNHAPIKQVHGHCNLVNQIICSSIKLQTKPRGYAQPNQGAAKTSLKRTKLQYAMHSIARIHLVYGIVCIPLAGGAEKEAVLGMRRILIHGSQTCTSITFFNQQ